MKRAALIITDADIPLVWWDGGPYDADVSGTCPASEQLLADLGLIALFALDQAFTQDVRDAAARVRELLPKEAQDGE